MFGRATWALLVFTSACGTEQATETGNSSHEPGATQDDATAVTTHSDGETAANGNDTEEATTDRDDEAPEIASAEDADPAAPDTPSGNAQTDGEMAASDPEPPAQPDASEDGSASEEAPPPIDSAPSQPGPPPSIDCAFEVTSETSLPMSLAGSITWSVDVTAQDVWVEFWGDDEGPVRTVPLALSLPLAAGSVSTTPLLGLRGSTDYQVIVRVESGGTTCQSDPVTLSTGYLLSSLPFVHIDVLDENAETADGYVILSEALPYARTFIIDMNGDIVWYGDAPGYPARGVMDWAGNSMWMVGAGPGGEPGGMTVAPMDGSAPSASVPGMEAARIDATASPRGIATFFPTDSECVSLVERDDSGEVNVLVSDLSLALATPLACEVTALSYAAGEDQYLVSFDDMGAIVAFDMAGAVRWQLGGPAPEDGAWAHYEAELQQPMGQQWLASGELLVFERNEDLPNSRIAEYSFTTDTPQLSWQSEAEQQPPLWGDVTRLPNGNTLIAYGATGQLSELTPDGLVVKRWSIQPSSIAHISYRESLYGAPYQP